VTAESATPPHVDDVLKTLRWHRNAVDMVQAHGSHEALAHAREVLLEGWKEGADGDFNMVRTDPRDEGYARLTVYGEDNIAILQKAGVQIADKPSARER
jgi:hypothetical protein